MKKQWKEIVATLEAGQGRDFPRLQGRMADVVDVRRGLGLWLRMRKRPRRLTLAETNLARRLSDIDSPGAISSLESLRVDLQNLGRCAGGGAGKVAVDCMALILEERATFHRVSDNGRWWLEVSVKAVRLEDEEGDWWDLGDFRFIVSDRVLNVGLQGVATEGTGGNNPSSIGGYLHPHVSGGALCAGEATALLNRLLIEGRIYEAVDLLEATLRSYNREGSYNALETLVWTPCPFCGGADNMQECDQCGEEFCANCYAYTCSSCGDGVYVCRDCADDWTCGNCGARYCKGCWEDVRVCGMCDASLAPCCGAEARPCETCGEGGCTDCVRVCEICGRVECGACRDACAATSNYEALPGVDNVVRQDFGCMEVWEGREHPERRGWEWSEDGQEWVTVSEADDPNE